MFYIFHGDDVHSQRETVAKLKKRFGDAGMLDLNTTRLSGKGLTLRDLRGACDAMPFLAPVRLVLVDDYFSSKPPKEDVNALLAYLPNLPETTRLVFMESSLLSAKSRAVKLADADENGYVKLFEQPKGNALDRWIVKRAAEKGGTMAPAAANALALNAGGDLSLLDNEIEKLVVYKGDALIQPGDVLLLSPYAAEASIFELVDALGNRNGRKATLLFQQKLDEGVDPFYLFAMFVRQFRLLIQVKESAESGLNPAAIAKQIKQHSYVVGKVYRQAQSFSLSQLERIYAHLLTIDVDVKRGKTDMVTALNLLVATLAN